MAEMQDKKPRWSPYEWSQDPDVKYPDGWVVSATGMVIHLTGIRASSLTQAFRGYERSTPRNNWCVGESRLQKIEDFSPPHGARILCKGLGVFPDSSGNFNWERYLSTPGDHCPMVLVWANQSWRVAKLLSYNPAQKSVWTSVHGFMIPLLFKAKDVFPLLLPEGMGVSVEQVLDRAEELKGFVRGRKVQVILPKSSYYGQTGEIGDLVKFGGVPRSAGVRGLKATHPGSLMWFHVENLKLLPESPEVPKTEEAPPPEASAPLEDTVDFPTAPAPKPVPTPLSIGDRVETDRFLPEAWASRIGKITEVVPTKGIEEAYRIHFDGDSRPCTLNFFRSVLTLLMPESMVETPEQPTPVSEDDQLEPGDHIWLNPDSDRVFWGNTARDLAFKVEKVKWDHGKRVVSAAFTHPKEFVGMTAVFQRSEVQLAEWEGPPSALTESLNYTGTGEHSREKPWSEIAAEVVPAQEPVSTFKSGQHVRFKPGTPGTCWDIDKSLILGVIDTFYPGLGAGSYRFLIVEPVDLAGRPFYASESELIAVHLAAESKYRAPAPGEDLTGKSVRMTTSQTKGEVVGRWESPIKENVWKVRSQGETRPIHQKFLEVEDVEPTPEIAKVLSAAAGELRAEEVENPPKINDLQAGVLIGVGDWLSAMPGRSVKITWDAESQRFIFGIRDVDGTGMDTDYGRVCREAVPVLINAMMDVSRLNQASGLEPIPDGTWHSIGGPTP